MRERSLLTLPSLALAAAVLTATPAFGATGAAPFPDVPATHPEAEAIAVLRDLHALGGYPDGTFRPLQPITRAAVVQVAILASGQVAVVLPPGAPASYPDVPATHPSAGFIERAVQRGYLIPDGKASFRPDDPATRAEGLKLALTIFSIVPPEAETSAFVDLQPKTWEAAYARYAQRHGLLRTVGNSFAPSATLRRAELAGIVAGLLRDRGAVHRSTLPLPAAVPLALGWLLAALPMATAPRGRVRGGARAGWIAAALVLGPIGALLVLLRRIALVPEDLEADEALGRRRTFGRRLSLRLRRWYEHAAPSLLGLLLVAGYLVVLVHALRITATTVAASLPAIHG